jgi:hypothetical protein
MIFMYIVVNHQITDQEKFLAISTAGAPASEDFKLHAFLPAVSHKTATCFWEAPDTESLKQFLEPILGASSVNTYSEIDEKIAMGLPKATAMAM